MLFAGLLAASAALLSAMIALALLIPSNRRNTGSKHLALLVLVVTSYLLGVVAHHSPGLPARAPLQLLGLGIFMLGPALYLYTNTRITGTEQWRTVQLLHGLPAAVLLFDSLLPLNTTPIAGRHPELLGVLCYLHILSYVAVALKRLYLAHEANGLRRSDLRWLSSLLGACLLLALAGGVFALGRWLFDAISWPQQLWSITLMVGLTYLIAFFSLLDPAVFHVRQDKRKPYRNSTLDEREARVLWQSLEGLMNEHAPYRETQLKIGELAARLNTSANHLSQVVNQLGGYSFNQYLNLYRVREAQHLLREASPGTRTMLDIALAAGFNSESVFYRHFREQTGQTPRQFQRDAKPCGPA